MCVTSLKKYIISCGTGDKIQGRVLLGLHANPNNNADHSIVIDLKIFECAGETYVHMC